MRRRKNKRRKKRRRKERKKIRQVEVEPVLLRKTKWKKRIKRRLKKHSPSSPMLTVATLNKFFTRHSCRLGISMMVTRAGVSLISGTQNDNILSPGDHTNSL